MNQKQLSPKFIAEHFASPEDLTLTRRDFLCKCGMGFGAMTLATMFAMDWMPGAEAAAADLNPLAPIVTRYVAVGSAGTSLSGRAATSASSQPLAGASPSASAAGGTSATGRGRRAPNGASGMAPAYQPRPTATPRGGAR